MKKLLFVLGVVAINLSAMAQQNSAETLASSLQRDARIDELFVMRTSLLNNNQNTREVDMELASFGVRFPARVKLTDINGKSNIAFLLIEDYNTEQMAQKIARLKKETKGLEYLGIDGANHYCYATFEKNTSEKRIEKFLGEFLYEGYYIHRTPQVQLGALAR